MGLHDMLDFIGAAAWFEKVSNALVMSGNIYWRIKRPDIKRPFKLPLAVHISVCLLFWFLTLAPIMTADWTFGKTAWCIWRPILFYSSGFFLLIPMIPVYWYFVHRKWTGTKVERALVKAESKILSNNFRLTL